jgi:hypothetical protein
VRAPSEIPDVSRHTPRPMLGAINSVCLFGTKRALKYPTPAPTQRIQDFFARSASKATAALGSSSFAPLATAPVFNPLAPWESPLLLTASPYGVLAGQVILL